MSYAAKVLRILLLITLVLVFVFPFVWMLSTSLKTYLESIKFPPDILPKVPQFVNYYKTYVRIHFLHYAMNSVIVTFSIVLGQLLVCIPAAYAFAKKKFRFAGLFFAIILIDLVLPAQVTFVPIYVLVSDFGWLDTYWAMIIPFIYSSFAIFFMTQAFKQIPDELLDAARMDKATELQIIVQLMLPIAKPFVLTAMLFTCISKWNDYFWPLILTNSESVRTLPMTVKGMISDTPGLTHWNELMAGNMMLIIPILVLYIAANRFIKNAFVYGIK
ncbi:carbohydrate ABC transporter membrane protein 2 (CUT1 family) [Paenibacillus taihuensis]|uniref:Carbohydrate ABC transporter membrane protein 2 (CUT1 family) n=1 Tax=Paenibacillus taihuensis TaxID=1156355 RepID=A0A3D9SEB7_9BACL|nr:carbohydrate ABC transporter permease [Paenibacillus taihuensis]REE92937.1 carbohydrate ABC transporter membrane protein 2 (CUT1 family) [Paenibacillus taihuensis]